MTCQQVHMHYGEGERQVTTTAEGWIPQLPDDSFGDRLKALRKSCDLTAVEMAKKLGVARPTYQTWEGDTLPRDVVNVTTRVVDTFGVCRDWLLWGSCTHDTHGGPSQNWKYLSDDLTSAAAA